MTWDAARDETSNGAAELITVRSAVLDDDVSFFELLLLRPDLAGGDLLFLADGRGWEGTGTGWPLAIGWRREGGPVILAATTGAATGDLLVEPLQLAGASASWSVEEWEEKVAAWWDGAPPGLRERVGERWGLPAVGRWGVAAWTRAVWDAAPAGGRAAIGVAATRVPAPVLRAVEWLARRESAAVFRIRWYGAEAGAVPRLEPIGGGWASPPAEDAPVESGGVRRLVAALDALALEIGGTTSGSAGWMRVAGRRRSLRVFPGADGVDLQLVGLDEGTCAGLRYRFGVPLSLQPPPGAPPGVHLRVQGPELGSPLEALIRFWLEAPPEPAAEPLRELPVEAAPIDGPPKPRKPRNPRRRRG